MKLELRANVLVFVLLALFLPFSSLNASTINAYVSNSYGSGTGFTLSTSEPIPYSPTSAINSSNAQNSLWLLTCPNAPDISPSGPSYFNNNPPPGQAPVGGNQCMIHQSSASFDVITSAVQSPSYYDSYSVRAPYSSTQTGSLMGTPLTSSLTGSGLLAINTLGFGAEVDNYISDAFSQNVNVFGQTASQNLHLLWSWVSDIPYISSSKYLISYSPSACDKNGNCVGTTGTQSASSGPYTTSIFLGSPSGASTQTDCSYPTYSYLSNVNVMNFGSTYIPYTELLGSTSSQNTFNSKIFPYLTYQISLPSLFSQTLNLQYYLFSPAIYHTPSNQLDALPISIGGQFYAAVNVPNVGVQLAMGTAQSLPDWKSSSLKTTVTNPQASTPSKNGAFCYKPSIQAELTFLGEGYDPYNFRPDPFPGAGGYLNSLYCNYCQENPGQVGICNNVEFMQYLASCTGQTYPSLYGDNGQVIGLGNLEPTPAYCQPYTIVQSAKTSIQNPISIVSIPTDYTYVLYKSSSGSYGIDVLRTIPIGRYDAGAPSVPAAPDSSIWTAEWGQYWQQVINLQNDNTYLVSQINPSVSSFTPINMTVDYSGDIFLTGTMSQNGALVPAIYEIPITGSSTPQAIHTTTLSNPSGSDYMMPEIAASPTGKYVYLANQSDGGYIYEYSATSDPSTGAISIAPTSQPINLAYQGSTSGGTGQSSMLNIAYWLENKGLYNQTLPFDIAAYLSSYTHPAGLETDAPTYHHPIGLQDVNGYIYVLDNWAGTLDISQTQTNCIFDCTYQGLFFSTLNMRIIDTSNQQSGLNVPISPTLFNDLFTTKTSACTLSFPSGSSPNPTNCYPQGSPAPTCVVAGTSGATQSSSGCSSPIVTSCNLQASTPASANGPVASGESYLCTTASSKSTTYTALATPTPFASLSYPPYGWIISANIMEGQLVNSYGSDLYTVSSNPSTSYSICSASSGNAACTLNPSNLNSQKYFGTFQPVGPHILALDQQAANAKLCIFVIFCTGSSNDAIKYSGDLRSAFAPHYYNTGFSIGFNGSVSLLFTTGTSPSYGGILNEYPYTASNPNAYNALIFTGLNAQNYTKLFDGNSQVSCYVDDPSIVSATGCKQLGEVMYMQPPVYNMPDPLKFVENLGGGQGLTFIGSVASGYQAPSTNPADQCTPTASQGVVCNGVSVPGTASTSQSGSVATPDVGLLPPLQQYATATISGDVYVPYQFTSVTDQQWNSFTGGTCRITQTFATRGNGRTPPPKITIKYNQSLSAPLISPPLHVVSTLYTYGTSPIFTNTINLPLEGGSLYLQDLLNNYYQQNLSDIGLTLTPQLIYNVESNRQIADTIINITTNNLHNGNGNQYILNATHALDYFINTYSQGGNPGYQLITSVPSTNFGIPQNGIQAAVNVLSNADPRPLPGPESHLAFALQNYFGSNVIYSLTPKVSTVATLFNFYISMADATLSNFYISNTLLSSSGPGSLQNYQVLGYNRLVYLFRDKFNNTFFAPIDADIANPTKITLQVSPNVDSINANKTTLNITGTATYTINGATQPLPVGSNINIYYGQNLNFANYDPLLSPADAQSCAFLGTPTAATLSKISPSLLSSACAIASPLSPDSGIVKISNLNTYHTSYNAPSTDYPKGDCAPLPNQLLTPKTYNCNINDPATQSCPASPAGNQQYCIPQISDGSGICTSQLGLIGVAQTDVNGAFTLGTTDNSIVACGIGSASIHAVYYGATSPQPRIVLQTPLTFASNPSYTCDAGKCTQSTIVNNYYYSPNSQSQTVPIGLFELSYGDVGLAVLAISMLSVMAVLLSKRNKAIYTRKRKIKSGRR